ncbi:MAG: hypothetical protein EZS28_011189 [Streblomastix strix]|uniref:Uncharacterized protein n=1 Tax=Streblomastix strix TaxID=222440 RepID=A0A5J4WE89_9EUKA|nr:MAG: hypothetical protein EZS28_011189 [Streblomastix strix]
MLSMPLHNAQQASKAKSMGVCDVCGKKMTRNVDFCIDTISPAMARYSSMKGIRMDPTTPHKLSYTQAMLTCNYCKLAPGQSSLRMMTDDIIQGFQQLVQSHESTFDRKIAYKHRTPFRLSEGTRRLVDMGINQLTAAGCAQVAKETQDRIEVQQVINDLLRNKLRKTEVNSENTGIMPHRIIIRDGLRAANTMRKERKLQLANGTFGKEDSKNFS